MLPGRAGLNADEAIYLRFTRRFLALARRPYREVHHQLRDLNRDGHRIPGYAVLSFLSFADEQGAWHGDIVARRDTMTARIALAQVALAVKAYQARFSRRPPGLSAGLEKSLGWKPREDPFSGRALRYRMDAKGFLIYSIGGDLRDDGGQPQRNEGTLAPGDLVWRGTWEPVAWHEAPEPPKPKPQPMPQWTPPGPPAAGARGVP